MEALLNPAVIVQHLHTTRFGWTLYFFPALDSTNEYAKKLALQGIEEGTLILTDFQTQGKGRRGRSFFSPHGGLYLSLILCPSLSPKAILPLTLLAGVAVAQSIQRCTGLSVRLRWPNDLFLAQKKVGGILIEMLVRETEKVVCIVGIGVNINTPLSSFPAALRSQITSLAHVLRRSVSRELLVCHLLSELEIYYHRFLQEGLSPFVEIWKTLAFQIGTMVRLSVGGEVVEGILQGLDAEGRLVIKQGKQLRTIVSGEYL